jgi:hypothetical protein
MTSQMDINGGSIVDIIDSKGTQYTCIIEGCLSLIHCFLSPFFFKFFSSNHVGAGSTSKAHEEGNNPLELPGTVHLCVC